MTARQLSQLLYAAEEANRDKKDPCVVEWCETELPATVTKLLSCLIDSHKDRQELAQMCEVVYGDRQAPHFWRALAAHHRALNCQPDEEPDTYFPKAMSLIGPIYSRPKEEKNDQPTSEGSYIFHTRVWARYRLGLITEDLKMLQLGATTAIHEGWFEAPDWTHDVCSKLAATDERDQAKLLMNQLSARSHPDQPHCYFSRLGRARLMEAHGMLIAA